MRSALFTVDVREKVTGVQIHMASSDYGDEDVIQVVNTRVNRFALNAEVFPHNATDRRVLWESLDPRVQIDAEGNVLIPKDVTTGVCQVLVKTVDGDRRAVRKIKINQGVKSIVLTAIREDLTWQEQHTMDFRKDMELKVEVFPLTAHNKGVLAVSSDPDLVSAEYNMSQKRIILRPRKKPSVKPGNIFFGGAIISAVAEDGGGATGTFQLSIMEALEWPSL